MGQKLEFVLFFLILSLYFILRLSFLNTIEFGYDQPLLTNQVIAFLKNPTFIDSFNYVTENPWGHPSWGPMQIIFYAPFVLLSQNPILLSLLIAIFNSISIIAIYLIGKLLISPKAGLLAALLLTVHPWWLIFSRMIYQPSPIITLISLTILLSVYIYKNPKSKWIFLLPICWAFIFQVYIHTISFIIPSIILLFTKINKTKIFSTILGTVIALVLFIPVFNYYSHNPNKLLGYKKVEQTFNKLYIPPIESLKNIGLNFFTIVSGSGWNWQLGYGRDIFYQTNPALLVLHQLSLLLVLVYLVLFTYLLLKQKQKLLHLLILLWLIGPIWFLFWVKSPITLPRYLLISLPLLSLIISFVTHKLGQLKIKRAYDWIRYVNYIGPIILCYTWLFTSIAYYRFVGDFNYPQGFLSNYSDVPYIYVQKSLDWIFSDAHKNNYVAFTISNSLENTTVYDLNAVTRYALDNVYHYQYIDEKMADTHYIMTFKPISDKYLKPLVQFGPYVIIKLDNNIK